MKLLINFLILISLFTFLLSESFGQSQFQLTVGGANNEFSYSMVQTEDGGFVSTGYTNSFGALNYDFYIVKLDAGGMIQWSRTVGGDSNDVANSIIQTADGGYAAAGYSASFGPKYADFYIVKLDATGNVQWSKTIGGDSSDVAFSIRQTADGGYITVGYTRSFGAGYYDIYIVKLDSAGEYQWSKTIGSTLSEVATSVIVTADGGYALSGYGSTTTTNSIDYYIIKLNSDGTLQWNTTIGGTAHDYSWGITQSADGGFAVTGYCQGFGAGASDLYVVKVNSIGTVQWTRTVGSTGSEMGWSIIQASDGSLITAGHTNSFGAGGADVYIVKLSSSGALQWSRTVGSSIHDIAQSFIITNDGGYVAGGTTYTISNGWYALADMYIVKFNANWNTCGNSRTQKSKSGTGGTTSSQIVEVNSPAPVVTSPVSTTGSGGTASMLCSHGNSPLTKNEFEESSQTPFKYQLVQNYPNPFNPRTSIKYIIANTSKVKLTVFDVLGHEVYVLVNSEQGVGSYEVTWDATNYPSGVYYYKLTAGDFTETKKMVLMK